MDGNCGVCKMKRYISLHCRNVKRKRLVFLEQPVIDYDVGCTHPSPVYAAWKKGQGSRAWCKIIWS